MRDIVLGNGTMMLNFDQDLNIRDLYWPYGGFENHGDGNRTNFGIYVDGRFTWISSEEWQKELGYIANTPITSIRAVNETLGIELKINDALHWGEDLYLKKITVCNLRDYTREVKIIFYQDFSIKGIEAGDSAVYDPKTGGICQYKKGCYLLSNCSSEHGGADSYSTGVKRFQGKEGTFKDAEDGELSFNPVADGPVDSAIGVRLYLQPGTENHVYYWIIAGYTLDDIRSLNQRFLERTPEIWLQEMVSYYRSWISRARLSDAVLPAGLLDLVRHSLFIIKSQLDRKGAVVASPDADTFLVARDHYMYLWPRDAAMVAHSLDVAGYPEEARRIYNFCSRVIHGQGYFLQRYNTDGTPGCTWHPLILNGREVPPIQEDETALVIWALGKHFSLYRDIDFVAEIYETLVKPALSFMSSYIDSETGLVAPSWDLWEERRGIFTFTCGAVFGALEMGSLLAGSMEDHKLAEQCASTAERLHQAMRNHLYSRELGRFTRGLIQDSKGRWTADMTIDSSLYGLFAFGAFSSNDPLVVSSLRAVEEYLWVKTEIGGIARYPGDYYHKIGHDIEKVPGNPWIVTTLWLADWHIAKGSQASLERALQLMEWAANKAGAGKLLPEQVNPYTGEPVSVCPLTWSHSTLVKVVVDYLVKLEQNGLH